MGVAVGAIWTKGSDPTWDFLPDLSKVKCKSVAAIGPEDEVHQGPDSGLLRTQDPKQV